ncbi:MAG: glycoside hydrolase family 3 C-terminal domain-containing protein, partial [Flavobacteriales bacterium]
INGQLLIDRWDKRSHHEDLISYDFRKNEQYDIRVEFKETQGNGWIQLIWKKSALHQQKIQQKQISSWCKKAAANVVVVGIEEGEFNDRASLRLSQQQEDLIHQVAKSTQKTIVVLVGGSAINMTPWIEEVDGILAVWYPGESGGNSVANILKGTVNPSGKLPITYPMSEAQLPLVYNHLPTGRGDDYRNLSGEPLFPFGYGLSYTSFQFQYDSTQVGKQYQLGDTIRVQFNVSNTGSCDGAEVVQCYLKSLYATEIRPVQELVQFQKISLKTGESKVMQENIILNQTLSTFGLTPGRYELQIGSSSKDIRFIVPFTIQE